MGLLFEMKDRFIKEWEEFKPTNNKDNPLEIIIKPEILDTSNIQEGEGSKEFRPTLWSEYIGQNSAKEKAINFIKGCQNFGEPYPHTFISSPPGMGKTLFASILAHQLNKTIIITTGGELKTEQIFIDKLVECSGGIIFIDEANKLPKKVGFFILPLMEQFTIHGKNLKRFTLIFASTHKGDISKDLDALISRCDSIELQQYNTNELVQIIKQYHQRQYTSIEISELIYNEIALNCKQTPRLAKNLIRAYAYIQNWEKVKEYSDIVINGLTKNDIRILKLLSQFPKGVGKNTIANYLRVKPQTYEYEYEPFLVFQEFVIVENRRKITKKGEEFLNQIKGV